MGIGDATRWASEQIMKATDQYAADAKEASATRRFLKEVDPQNADRFEAMSLSDLRGVWQAKGFEQKRQELQKEDLLNTARVNQLNALVAELTQQGEAREARGNMLGAALAMPEMPSLANVPFSRRLENRLSAWASLHPDQAAVAGQDNQLDNFITSLAKSRSQSYGVPGQVIDLGEGQRAMFNTETSVTPLATPKTGKGPTEPLTKEVNGQQFYSGDGGMTWKPVAELSPQDALMLGLASQNPALANSPAIQRILNRVGGGAGPATQTQERVRVKGPNGEKGTVFKGSALPEGWSLR